MDEKTKKKVNPDQVERSLTTTFLSGVAGGAGGAVGVGVVNQGKKVVAKVVDKVKPKAEE